MKCIFSLFRKCLSQRFSQYIDRLVRAVNKLCEATSRRSRVDYTEGAEEDALVNSIRVISLIAKELDNPRLERVAAEDELREQISEINRLKQEIAQLTVRNDELTQKNTDLARRNVELQAALDTASADVSSDADFAPGIDFAPDADVFPDADVSSDAESKSGLVLSLINFRDQLLYFQDEFRDDGDERAVKLLGTLYKETGRLMNEEDGVESLEGGGDFSTDIHMVTSTESTHDQSLDNTIARTFRAGYRINGKLHRPQEVVLYVYKPKEGA